MNSNPVSIKLFLINGNSTGLRTAEISNWSGKALAAPRTEVGDLRRRDEIKGAGVYFLIGISTESNEPILYIGESGCVADRLKTHVEKGDKEFWVHTLVFVSKDDNLSKAHVCYLESRLMDIAQQNPHLRLDNRTKSNATLSEADSAEMEKFLQRLLQLLPVLGVHFFSNPELMLQRSKDKPAIFNGAIAGAVAQGFRTDEGFLILKGSTVTKEARPSCSPSIIKHRDFLLKKGILAEEGEFLVFTQDFETISPGMAGSIIAGGSMNGLVFWKDSKGRTLKELGG